MTTKSSFSLALALSGIVSVFSYSTEAAVITWGPATQINGDSNVSTAGTLIGAFNVGNAGVGASGVINGVNFQPFALPNPTLPPPAPAPTLAVALGVVGGSVFTIQTTDSVFASSNGGLYDSAAAPFINLSTNYKNLLRSGSETDAFNSLELTMAGLLPGALYQFQWWSNFSGIGTADHSAVNPGGDFVDLLDNTSGAVGGLGQYTIGTFRADNVFESVSFLAGPSGLTGALLNGFQLRQTAIPEPSTILFGVALAGVCFGRRKRVAKAGVSIA